MHNIMDKLGKLFKKMLTLLTSGIAVSTFGPFDDSSALPSYNEIYYPCL